MEIAVLDLQKQSPSCMHSEKNRHIAGGVRGSQNRPSHSSAPGIYLTFFFFFRLFCILTELSFACFDLRETSGFSLQCRQSALILELSSMKSMVWAQ